MINLGLSSWREAVQRSVTSSQLSMALYTLEQCVAWDKSIMKAVNMKFCNKNKPINHFSFNRIVNFVNRASRKINCCSVTAVIEATILIASNPNSRKFPRAIGEFFTHFKCEKVVKNVIFVGFALSASTR